MSANINFSEDTQTYSFVSNKQIPWWGGGQILDHAFTAEEAIEQANLGYTVEKRPVYIREKNTLVDETGVIITSEGNQYKEIKDQYATVRTDNNEPLGIVGSKYTVLQNKDAFGFFDSIVGEGKAIYETAGVLGKGERIFLTAKLPEKLLIAPDDAIDQYLFLTNSHDGSGSITAAFTTVRIVCANTLAMALSKSIHKVKFRHTASAKDNLSKAAKMMGIAVLQGEQMEENYRSMSKVRITDKELLKFIEIAMNPKVEKISEDEFSTEFKNKVANVMEYAHTDDTQIMETTKGTLYGAVQAISGYYNNVVNYKTSEDKINGLMYGVGNRNSNKAYDLGLQYLTDDSILS